MLHDRIIKVISICIDIAFCLYAVLSVVRGRAEPIHYSILIGSILGLGCFIINQFRTKDRKVD